MNYKLVIAPFALHNETIHIIQIVANINNNPVVIWIDYLNEYDDHTQIEYNLFLIKYVSMTINLANDEKWTIKELSDKLDMIQDRIDRFME